MNNKNSREGKLPRSPDGLVGWWAKRWGDKWTLRWSWWSVWSILSTAAWTWSGWRHRWRRSGAWCWDLIQGMAQVHHQARSKLNINLRSVGKGTRDFLGTSGEASPELLVISDHSVGRLVLFISQLLQVSHSQLQNVRFLQPGDILALTLQPSDKDVLQLIQTAVDAGSALTLKQRLGNLRKKMKRKFSKNAHQSQMITTTTKTTGFTFFA